MQESTQTKSDYRLKELESRLGFVDLGRLFIAKPLIQRIIIDSVKTETTLKTEKEKLNTRLKNTRNELLELTKHVKNVLNSEIEKLKLDLEKEKKHLEDEAVKKTEELEVRKRIVQARVKELERIESEVIVPKHAYKPDNLKIVRGGDWKIEANQSVFYYKIKVSNQSKLVISKI